MQIDDIVGNKYNYQGTDIYIKKIKKVANNTVILADKRTYNLLENEVKPFLNDLKEPKNKRNDDLKDILYSAIDRVNNDENYVKQANAVCNIASRIISLKKLDLK